MSSSKRSYYRVLDDLEYPKRWHLRAPVTAEGKDVSPWQFTEGRVLTGLPPLQVPVANTGVPLDFTFAGFDIPVLARSAQDAIVKIAPDDVRLIPVQVTGQPAASDSYAVLNVVKKGRCLDESRSDFTKWKPSDKRPDKTGSYRMVTKLVIDPECAPADLFRLEGWSIALIVSEAVRDALSHVSGIQFQPV